MAAAVVWFCPVADATESVRRRFQEQPTAAARSEVPSDPQAWGDGNAARSPIDALRREGHARAAAHDEVRALAVQLAWPLTVGFQVSSI